MAALRGLHGSGQAAAPLGGPPFYRSGREGGSIAEVAASGSDCGIVSDHHEERLKHDGEAQAPGREIGALLRLRIGSASVPLDREGRRLACPEYVAVVEELDAPLCETLWPRDHAVLDLVARALRADTSASPRGAHRELVMLLFETTHQPRRLRPASRP